MSFADKNNLVSGPLKILKNTAPVEVKKSLINEHEHEGVVLPWFPSIGDLVLCIFLPNGKGDGFVVGGI